MAADIYYKKGINALTNDYLKEELENRYQDIKGNLLKGAKLLEEIHSFEEKMREKISEMPGIP